MIGFTCQRGHLKVRNPSRQNNWRTISEKNIKTITEDLVMQTCWPQAMGTIPFRRRRTRMAQKQGSFFHIRSKMVTKIYKYPYMTLLCLGSI